MGLTTKVTEEELTERYQREKEEYIFSTDSDGKAIQRQRANMKESKEVQQDEKEGTRNNGRKRGEWGK